MSRIRLKGWPWNAKAELKAIKFLLCEALAWLVYLPSLIIGVPG